MTEVDQIINEVQSGDTYKYTEIVERFQQPLYAYLVHQLGDNYEAQDILQDVFITAYENIKFYKLNGRFSPWIYKIAHNLSVNYIKKRSRVKLFSSFNSDLEKNLEKKSKECDNYYTLNSTLKNALMQLSSKDRTLIYLRILEERPYEEISKILGIPSNTLRKRYERAKINIKKYFEVTNKKEANKDVIYRTKN